MIGIKPGVEKIIEVDPKFEVAFADREAFVVFGQPRVAQFILRLGATLFDVDMICGQVQRRAHCLGHGRQPLRPGLFAHVFGDNRVTRTPVDHRPHLGDIPVVKAEAIDAGALEALAQMTVLFADAVTEELGVMRRLFRCNVFHGD